MAAAAVVQPRAPARRQEHSSFANHDTLRVTHADFELQVDFDKRCITGTAKLTAVAQSAGADRLVLDTRDLALSRAALLGPGGAATPLQLQLAPPHKVLGSALTLPLPAVLAGGESVTVEVAWATAPTASALQWLTPAQTAGGQHPYLFTQCQAIHARSFVPCQDTPGAKLTYTAAVTVPAPLTALMSAVPLDDPAAPPPPAAAATRTFRFRQAVPIPPYLLALAVGQLAAAELSPRCRVWSEPATVAAAAHEFADTADFLAAGEEVAGEYVWGRYDLLLLPPSFPYGGMENPNLTFVTPTLLAGDRSLAGVVAHEIAHSWTGNLVTNATWEHFWLNEGWTVFLERKIAGRLKGEATRQWQAATGALELAEAVRQLGAGHPFTALVPDLSGGVDPDDAFSKIPYEKGFYFLYYLEGLVGGASMFEPFAKAYVQQFRYKALTSDDFKDFFCKYFADTPRLSEIDWDTWFYKPGMPPVENQYDTSLGQAAFDLARRWHASDVMGIGGSPPEGASPADMQGWSSDQVVAFLDKLSELRSLQALHPSTTRQLARLYGLDDSNNAEIRASWYQLCIDAGDATINTKVADFLTEQGRMKYLRPLYRALFRSQHGRQLALDTFAQARDGYHPIAAKMVASDLHLADSATA